MGFIKMHRKSSSISLAWLLSFVCCLLIAGSAIEAKAVDHPKENGYVILIFRDCPYFAESYLFHGKRYIFGKPTVIDYVDDNSTLHHFIPHQVGCDTLKIPTFNGYAEISHRYRGIEDNYYMLKAGDTVLFTYLGENNRPFVRSLVSEANTFMYRFGEDDPRYVWQSTGYNIFTMCTDWWIYDMWKGLSKDKNNKYIKAALNGCKIPNIDSLRNILTDYKSDISGGIDSLVSANKIFPWYGHYLKSRNRESDNKLTKTEMQKILSSDSLMHYVYSHHIAQKYAHYGVSVTLEKFKKMTSDTSVSKPARLTALRAMMDGLYAKEWNFYSSDLRSKCTAVYINLTGDSSYIVNTKKFYPVKEGQYTDDLVVENIKGKRLRLGDIIKSHKGKVIYIDLWASWCGACVAGMPAALKLRQEYSGKDVVFLYLDVSDEAITWKRAMLKYKTAEYSGENYLVLNSKESKFIKELKMIGIPWMLIYDKNGKLVNDNAPRPDNSKLKPILNALLKQ